MLKHTFRKKRTENRPKLLLLQLTLKLLTSIHIFVVHIYWLKNRTWDRFYLILKSTYVFCLFSFINIQNWHIGKPWWQTVIFQVGVTNSLELDPLLLIYYWSTKRKRYIQTRRAFHPLIHFPNTQNGQAWTTPKPWAWNPIQVFHICGRDPTAWAITCCSPVFALAVQSREMLALRSRHADRGFEYFNHILNY